MTNDIQAEQRRDILSGRASALSDSDDWHTSDPDFVSYDGDQLEREERAAMRRVAGLSTEIEDVTEVEYRQLRLENVVLIGVYSGGSLADAENSLRELAALALLKVWDALQLVDVC